jgi:hypothetical protein
MLDDFNTLTSSPPPSDVLLFRPLRSTGSDYVLGANRATSQSVRSGSSHEFGWSDVAAPNNCPSVDTRRDAPVPRAEPSTGFKTFARLSEFSGARNVARTLRNKQPDLPLISGRESNTTDLVAFDDFYNQLRRLVQQTHDLNVRLNTVFWQKIRGMLAKYREPMGFQNLPSANQSLPIGYDLIDGFHDRVLEQWRSILPLQSDALAATLDIQEDDVVNQLLLATRVGLVNIRFAVECSGCKCDLGQVGRLGDLCETRVRCPLCEINTDVTSLDQIKVRFFLHNDVLYCPMHNIPCTRLSQTALQKTKFACLIPATEGGSGFSFPLRSILPKGRYQFRCRASEYEKTLIVEGDANQSTPVYDWHLRMTCLRDGTRRDQYTCGEKVVVPHGKLNVNLYPDTGALMGLWITEYIVARDIDFLVPREEAERFVPASQVINHPLFLRSYPNELLHPDVILTSESTAIAVVQICDFVELLTSSGDAKTMLAVRAVRKAVAKAFEVHGRLVKATDDWCIGTFNSTGDAVLACGRAFRYVTDALNKECPLQQIAIRCGVHVGRIAVCPAGGVNDVSGLAVVRAHEVARGGGHGALLLSTEAASTASDAFETLLREVPTTGSAPKGNATPRNSFMLEASRRSDPRSIDGEAIALNGLQWLGDKFVPLAPL